MIFPELTFLRTVLGKSSILNRICAIKLNEPDARNTQRVWLSAQRSLGTALEFVQSDQSSLRVMESFMWILENDQTFYRKKMVYRRIKILVNTEMTLFS